MPTVLRWKGYRFYFFSNEGAEPAHIHIDKAECTAKFWLADGALARHVGFSSRELAELSVKVREEAGAFQEAWRGYFGG